jgi:phytoene/squalene synthetase
MNIDAFLAELKIPREAYRLVMLLPLVYVAWADGKIQPEERKLIMRIASEKGMLANGGRETLETWLTLPPTEQQLKANLRALNELCRGRRVDGQEFDADSEQLLLAWCQDVADAAGGLLGLRSARHAAEAEALKKISAALDIGGAKNWRALFT